MTLEQRLALAEENLGRSVVRINPGAIEEAAGKAPGYAAFGIKNTADIPKKFLDKLRNNPEYLWLTVDRMSPLGRSVDTGLANPLTYRYMTGSSSGGAVNLLHCINDVAVGTDGGGSVLAPALAASLFSFLGKGLGWQVEKEGQSTDGLGFVAGLGLLGHNLSLLYKTTQILQNESLPPPQKSLRVAVPAAGCMPLPGGGDSAAALKPLLERLEGVEPVYHSYKSIYDRAATVQEVQTLFAQNAADLLLTLEGPVDVYAYDETIPRAFGGAAPMRVAGVPSKGLVKAANIAGCSALTVPSASLATGYVILCPPGVQGAANGFALAAAIAGLEAPPKMFRHFFAEGGKFVPPSDYA